MLLTLEHLSKHDFVLNTVIISLPFHSNGMPVLEHKTQALILGYDIKTRKAGKGIVKTIIKKLTKS